MLSTLDNYYANKIYNTQILNIYDNEILLATSKNVKYSKVVIICHSVCSNYKELATLANKLIKNSNNPFQIIMWDVLSGDFDTNISGEQCFINVTNNTENGSIIVFHDSDKAWERLSYTLPKILELYSKQGFEFKAL